jgi:hypothetical protein
MIRRSVNPFRVERRRASALRRLKRALVALATVGTRRDLLIVRTIFDWIRELRSA